MVEEVKTTDIAPAAPVTETVVAAPAAETPKSNTDSIPAVQTPAASTPVEAASSSDTVVKAEAPKEEKAADGVLGAEVAPKKEEAKVVSEPVKPVTEAKVESPVYDEFKLPENVKFEKEPLDVFTKILGEIETGKLDHKGMQEVGQKLVDLAAKNTVDSINRMNDYYVQLHKDNIQKRVTSLKADPDLGGENFENTVSLLQESVRTYGGTEAQIAEFRKEITESGLSASPAVCRLIYNMQQKINKYTTEQSGPSIVPGAKPAPTKVKPYQQFYGGAA